MVGLVKVGLAAASKPSSGAAMLNDGLYMLVGSSVGLPSMWMAWRSWRSLDGGAEAYRTCLQNREEF